MTAVLAALANGQPGEVVLVQTQDDEVASALRWVSDRVGVSGTVPGPGLVRGTAPGSPLQTG